jgi:hypothetical protein
LGLKGDKCRVTVARNHVTVTHFTTLVAAVAPTLLSAGGFTNGNWRLLGTGDASSHFTVSATMNFVQRTNIGSATSDVSGSFIFIDSDATQFKSRFYRTTN